MLLLLNGQINVPTGSLNKYLVQSRNLAPFWQGEDESCLHYTNTLCNLQLLQLHWMKLDHPQDKFECDPQDIDLMSLIFGYLDCLEQPILTHPKRVLINNSMHKDI
jgi:hypothetical protein